MALWITILGAALGGLLLLPLVQVLLGVHPPRHRSSITPDGLGLAYEPVRFTTEDEVELAGWWLPSGTQTNAAVIVGHGYPMDKGDVLPAVAFLQQRYHVLLFDHRSFGDSEGQITTLGLRETADVRAAVDYALDRDGVETVAAWGFSLSASTILRTNDPRLACIVAEAPFADLPRLVEDLYRPLGPLKGAMAWLTLLYARLLVGLDGRQVDIARAVAAESPPVLLIHGDADAQVPPEHSERIAEVLGDRGERWLVEGAGHGAAQAVQPEAYHERVMRFLAEHLDDRSTLG